MKEGRPGHPVYRAVDPQTGQHLRDATPDEIDEYQIVNGARLPNLRGVSMVRVGDVLIDEWHGPGAGSHVPRRFQDKTPPARSFGRFAKGEHYFRASALRDFLGPDGQPIETLRVRGLESVGRGMVRVVTADPRNEGTIVIVHRHNLKPSE